MTDKNMTPENMPCLDMRYPHPVRFRGRVFPSAENAFQSARFRDPATVEKFKYMDPGRAAYMGAVLKADPWPDEGAMDSALAQVLEAKFSDPFLKKELLRTGSARIELLNFRHENYAGACRCPLCRNRGKDTGGRLLMELRASLLRP